MTIPPARTTLQPAEVKNGEPDKKDLKGEAAGLQESQESQAAKGSAPHRPSSAGEEDPGAALDLQASGEGQERGGGEIYRQAVLASDAAHRQDKGGSSEK